MENKNPIIDALKGIAIILVVYGHVIQRTMTVSGADFFLNPAFKIIYTFHLPLFVFLSGYLMAYSLGRRSISDAFRARCRSLLVPCISWGILDSITNYFLEMIDGKNMDIVNFPRDLLVQLVINPSVWFLFTLFILSCLLLYSIKLQKRFGAAIFVLVYLLLMMIPYNNYCALYYIKWFYLFYLVGYFINIYGMKITNKAIQMFVLPISIIMFIVLLSYWTKSDYIYINKMSFESSQYLNEILRILYRYVMGFLGIVIAIIVGTYYLNSKMKRFLGVLGVYSLDIYLIQRYLVEGVYPRVVNIAHLNFDFNSPFFLLIFVPLVTLFFVYVCLSISKLLIRKNYLLNRLLLGDRI